MRLYRLGEVDRAPEFSLAIDPGGRSHSDRTFDGSLTSLSQAQSVHAKQAQAVSQDASILPIVNLGRTKEALERR